LILFYREAVRIPDGLTFYADGFPCLRFGWKCVFPPQCAFFVFNSKGMVLIAGILRGLITSIFGSQV